MPNDTNGVVLITGSAGRVGRAAVRALVKAGCNARGFDRAPTPGIKDFIVGDLTDYAALRRAAEGSSTLIHLGATPDDDDFMTQLLPNNLVGLYHVLEAARETNVKRVMLASSGQVNWWQQREGPWPISVHDPFTPRAWYAVTKVAAEEAGKTYARNFGMTVLALRLGWCPRTRGQMAEIAASECAQDIYLSPGDAGRFFVRATEADLPSEFFTLFVTSRPLRKAIVDLGPTETLLGWKPQDQWPTGAEDGVLNS